MVFTKRTQKKFDFLNYENKVFLFNFTLNYFSSLITRLIKYLRAQKCRNVCVFFLIS